MSRIPSRHIGFALNLTFQILLFAIATVVLIVISCRVYPKDADLHFNGIEKDAIARRVSVSRMPFSPLPQYVVRYRYEVNGKPYFGTGHYQMLVSPGDVLTIKYFPSAPQRSFVPGSANFTPVLLSISAALLCLNATIVIGVRLKRFIETPPTPSCVILHSPVAPDEMSSEPVLTVPDIMPAHRRA
jgi:hypothetical protein